MHRRMSKSVSILGPLCIATLLAASSCSEDSEPQGGEGGTEAQAGSGVAIAGAKATGGQSHATTAATGGSAVVSASAGGTGGTSSTTTLSMPGGASGQPGQTSSAASGGSASTTGPSLGGANAGGAATNSAGAAGVAGGMLGSAGTAGTAGATAAEDPRCASADPAQTLTAHLKITADNECDVYVNGQAAGQTSSWQSAVTLDVSLYVHPGRKNVVAVVGRNTSSQNGNDRGIIGELTTTVGTTTTPILVTNHDWLVSQSPGTDWALLDYDASTWIPATEVAVSGDPPWGAVMGAGSEAKWIWFAPIPNSTSDKPNLEATYTRRVFYFDFDGQLVDAPSCEAPGI